jgi:DNA-binding GntR family transcriptional regulator
MSAASRAPDAGSGQLLAERAYDELRDRIVTLRIAPGSPINDEAIAGELGMGRTPVREAVRRLVLENLAVVYPRRGTFAADINITDLAYISDIRVQLEGHAAQRAAERLTPAQRKDLDVLLAELDYELVRKDPAALIQLDARVHRFVYRCAANPYFEADLSRYYNLSLRIWYLVLDRLPGLFGSIAEHRALLEAIAERDGERARDLAAEHVLTFEREIRNVL